MRSLADLNAGDLFELGEGDLKSPAFVFQSLFLLPVWTWEVSSIENEHFSFSVSKTLHFGFPVSLTCTYLCILEQLYSGCKEATASQEPLCRRGN